MDERGQFTVPALYVVVVGLLVLVSLALLTLDGATVADPAAFERAEAQTVTSAEAPYEPLVSHPLASGIAVVVAATVAYISRRGGAEA